ncbi:hypothetical protein D3C79_1000290 [compost metagenome]
MARVIALADVVAIQLVVRGNRLECGQRLCLALPRGQREHTAAFYTGGDDAVDQRVE